MKVGILMKNKNDTLQENHDKVESFFKDLNDVCEKHNLHFDAHGDVCSADAIVAVAAKFGFSIVNLPFTTPHLKTFTIQDEGSKQSSFSSGASELGVAKSGPIYSLSDFVYEPGATVSFIDELSQDDEEVELTKFYPFQFE